MTSDIHLKDIQICGDIVHETSYLNMNDLSGSKIKLAKIDLGVLCMHIINSSYCKIFQEFFT